MELNSEAFIAFRACISTTTLKSHFNITRPHLKKYIILSADSYYWNYLTTEFCNESWRAFFWIDVYIFFFEHFVERL
jgi:hypothetical protein